MPEQLDEEELADWHAGRNAVYQLAARSNPRPHWRRPATGEGARRQARPETEPQIAQKREAIRRRYWGDTAADIARDYNVHPSTISRLTA